MSTEEPTIRGAIVVAQDVGGPFPDFRRVTLELMSDGSVRWRQPVAEDFPSRETRPQELGGTAP